MSTHHMSYARAAIKVFVVDARDLSSTLQLEWQRIQDQNPAFSSPFLGPGYTRLVARCRSGVKVGILQNKAGAIGFFPFETAQNGLGHPVGPGYCDYQVVLADIGLIWKVNELLNGVGLKSFRFDHFLSEQVQFQPFHRRRELSFLIDLPNGYESYAADLKRQKRNQIVQANQKRRWIEELPGGLSFSAHEPDPDLLDLLLAWKGAQWERSGRPGRFSRPWERALMSNLMTTDEPPFGGLLSVLRAGGQVVALHLGLRSRTVWHYWTPAYCPEASKYSPGIVLLDHMLRAAEGLGLRTIDLGKEDFLYKRRLMTRGIYVAEGLAQSGNNTHQPIGT